MTTADKDYTAFCDLTGMMYKPHFSTLAAALDFANARRQMYHTVRVYEDGQEIYRTLPTYK